jgi:Na+/proline symporter
MTSLSTLDHIIIFGALGLILLVGLAMSRKASKNLENYFLGGRSLPWYLLGVCGMSSWFDLTGTMIITSFLYMMGPQGLYVEFRGGAVLALAFLLSYTGKWHRRSGCMTPAEWVTYRFGTGFSAEMLRLVSAVMGIVTTIGMLAYLVRGATLFMAMIFPVDPVFLTIILLGAASLYTVMAGFYGVVLTDLVQGVIMIAGCVVISIIAWHQVPDAQALSTLAHQVTGNLNWIQSAPMAHVDMPKGYEAYEALLMATAFYFLRSVLGGLGSGAETRFFAARNTREASLQCLLQGVTIMFRWPLMISFAILGIVLVAKILPNQEAASQVAEVVRATNPALTANDWHTYTSRLVHNPETAPPGFVEQMTALLGPDWKPALLVIGSNGTVNPEVILPAVALHSLGSGLRGLIVVSLIAALMGALTGVVNSASALFVRDIYQNFMRPKAKNRELISMAYLSSALIIISSFAMGLGATSINDLWSWLIMGLTASSLGPAVLRLYWWRVNAWGMAAGIFIGGLAAVLQRAFMPHMNEWTQFSIMILISFGATIIGSLLTAETPRDIVTSFYRTTRPFGVWGPLWKKLAQDERTVWSREHRFDILSTITALTWQITLFLLPMQLLTRNWIGFSCTAPIFLAACVGLYFFWWKNLPSPNEKTADFASKPPPPHAPLTLEAARIEEARH